MILACEKCQTHFELDDARIPVQGAHVRCSRCRHRFHVKPSPAKRTPHEIASSVVENTPPEPDEGKAAPALAPPVAAAAPAVPREAPKVAAAPAPAAPAPPAPAPRAPAPAAPARKAEKTLSAADVPKAPKTPRKESRSAMGRDEEADLENPEFLFEPGAGPVEDDFEPPSEPLLGRVPAQAAAAERAAPPRGAAPATSIAKPAAPPPVAPSSRSLAPEPRLEVELGTADSWLAEDEPQPEPAARAPRGASGDARSASPPVAAPRQASSAPTPAASASPTRPSQRDRNGESRPEPRPGARVETPGPGSGEDFADVFAGLEESPQSELSLPSAPPGKGRRPSFVRPPRSGAERVERAAAARDAYQSGADLSSRAITRVAAALVAGGLLFATWSSTARFGIGWRPAPAVVSGAGWAVTGVESFHALDASGRRVLVVRGNLVSQGSAWLPAIRATLLAADGAPVGSSAFGRAEWLEGESLSPEALRDRLAASAAGTAAPAPAAAGRESRFTVLLPDAPGPGTRYRLELLNPS